MNATTKTARAEAIAQCITIAARHFDLDPFLVKTKGTNTGGRILDCRRILSFHFNRCGLALETIARIWGEKDHWNTETTKKNIRHTHLHGTGKHALLLSRLPNVPNTLNISNV